MLTRSLPRSVTCLLECFRGCFTTPTFTTLAIGFWAQPGLHTVTGMLVAAGLSQSWQHTRAHRFFSQARWSADQLGLCLLDLILALLVPTSTPVRLVLDDTVYRRSSRKVFGAHYHHDPLGSGRRAICWASAWVVLGVLVDLSWGRRPVCACQSWPACGGHGRPPGGWGLAVSWSGWSHTTSAAAASTWSATAPTPASSCGSCPGR